jgi:hypothetical protein
VIFIRGSELAERDVYPWIYDELKKKGWKVHDKSQLREEVRAGRKRPWSTSRRRGVLRGQNMRK